MQKYQYLYIVLFPKMFHGYIWIHVETLSSIKSIYYSIFYSPWGKGDHFHQIFQRLSTLLCTLLNSQSPMTGLLRTPAHQHPGYNLASGKAKICLQGERISQSRSISVWPNWQFSPKTSILTFLLYFCVLWIWSMCFGPLELYHFWVHKQ